MKKEQRNDARCPCCGEYPDREGDFRRLLWRLGIPAGDGDLETRNHVLYITRSDDARQDEKYRINVDARRAKDGDDERDTKRAKLLGKTGLLIIFPRCVEQHPDDFLWARQTDGIPIKLAEAQPMYPWSVEQGDPWRRIKSSDLVVLLA